MHGDIFWLIVCKYIDLFVSQEVKFRNLPSCDGADPVLVLGHCVHTICRSCITLL